MQTRKRKQVESAKHRAELAAANLMGDEDRADDFQDMSVEEYAELRGIQIQNPIMERTNIMASKIKELEDELEEANQRIEELEAEQDAVFDALGIELVEDDSEDENEFEEE